jgi:hypothetical protein
MNHNERRVNSPSAVATVTENTKQWFVAVIMSLSIALNVVMIYEWRDATMHTELKRYDLDFFKENDWAQLKAQVEIDRQLIEAYGLQNAVRHSAKEK